MEFRERPSWRVAGLSVEVLQTLCDRLRHGVGPTARGRQGDEEAAEGSERGLGEIGGAPGKLVLETKEGKSFWEEGGDRLCPVLLTRKTRVRTDHCSGPQGSFW